MDYYILHDREKKKIVLTFCYFSSMTGRERAMVINLEFIKAIVTAEEVLLLDPFCQEVLLFVNQLHKQIPLRNQCTIHEPGVTDMEAKGKHSLNGQSLTITEEVEGLQSELPFEFHVLEIALEVVCSYLDSSVVNLEINAYPALEELATRVSTKNLEHVRSLKSNITHLLSRVQKVISFKCSLLLILLAILLIFHRVLGI